MAAAEPATSVPESGQAPKLDNDSKVSVGYEFKIASYKFDGWVATVAWVSLALLQYCALEHLLAVYFPFNQEAEQRLHSVVPPMAYWLSSAAFFTAFVLSAVSLVFEDTAAKRQHALMSCLVKGVAAHCDVSLASSRAIVLLAPGTGAMWLPQHYLQWLTTVPTLLVSMSRTSDFTFKEVALVVLANQGCIIWGFVGNLFPTHYALACFTMSCLCMYYVLAKLHVMMLGTIGKDEHSKEARSSWMAIYWVSFAIWNTFPVAWLVGHLLPPPADLIGEVLVMIANFMAKVVLSSSVVFGNYLTASQRRLLMRQRQENAERVALVTQLTKAITEKDAFMSLMSHELRTPLNGIIQLSDFLCSGNCGDVGDKAKHFSTTIKNSGNHLLNIINDILDAAALKEGRLTIKHEEVNLADAVQNVFDIASALARKGVVLEQHVDPHTPSIIGDAGRVKQILFNLTGNALKFTHSGKVTISVRPGGQKHYVVINVTDTGCGIPKDKLTVIFEAFKQVDMSVSRKYGGTGLGLQIVQSLVEAHGGTISVSSVLDKGTKFTVRLPVLQTYVRKSLEMRMQKSLELKGYDYEEMLPLVAPGASTGPCRPSQQLDNMPPPNWVPRGDDSKSFSAYRSFTVGDKPASPHGEGGHSSSRLQGSGGSGKYGGSGHIGSMSIREERGSLRSGGSSNKLQPSGGSGGIPKTVYRSGASSDTIKAVHASSSSSSSYAPDSAADKGAGGGSWNDSTPETTKWAAKAPSEHRGPNKQTSSGSLNNPRSPGQHS